MTTQLRTTPATASDFPGITRKGAADPADSAANQFAAMFSALCFGAPPQAPATPAKSAEPARSDNLAVAELTGADGTLLPLAPLSILETPAIETGTRISEPTAPGASLATGPSATLFASEMVALVGLPEKLTPVDNTLTAPQPVFAQEALAGTTVQALPLAESPISLTPPPIGKATAATSVYSTDAMAEAVPAKNGSRGVVLDPHVQVFDNVAEQNLQIEAARRDANFVAGYLAKSYRTDREGSAGVKTLLAGNGFDLQGGERERPNDLALRLQLPSLAADASFAATERELQFNGGAGSIQAQTMGQIISQAEGLAGHEVRSVRLRLRPEELGQIDIQLSRDAAGRVSAHITAERESARAVLSRSVDQLRETLSRAGLTVDQLQISAEPGLFAGHRESADAQSTGRESTTAVASLLTANEVEAGGQPRAEEEKLLSLRA